jgi:hypothetical protein
MKRVGVREFRDHATQFLAGSDVLAIERHGRPIGFYVPAAATDKDAVVQALQRLTQAVERVRTEAGLGEEELSRLFGLNEPLAGGNQRPTRNDPSAVHAPRR